MNADQLAEILGISRAGAYQLLHQEGFPTLHIGKRMLVHQGLIVRVRQGVGRASRIYVKVIAGAENDPHDSQKTAGHAGEMLPTIKAESL